MRSSTRRSLSWRNIFAATSVFALIVGSMSIASVAEAAEPVSAPVSTAALGPASTAHTPQAPRVLTPASPSFASGPLRPQQLAQATQAHQAPATSQSASTQASSTPTSGQIGLASTGATGTSSFSGRVTSATNVGVAGSMVYATTQAGAEYWTTTDAFGNYTLGNVPAGTYTVYFDATVKQTVKNLLVGQSRQRVDARVALKAQIKGRVTATDGQGAAIPDVAVRVFSATNDSVPLAWTFTDSDGNYFVHGLPAGNVKVHFELDYVTSGSYLSSWNSGQASFFTADSLSLTATQLRTGVNAGLTRAGQISGQVHMADLPRYSGIWISLSDLASEWNTVAWASTDAEGRYVLRHVPTGRYRIKFQLSESNPDNFVPRWFSPMGTGESFALGGVISVTGDQIVTGIDQDLQAGGHIRGVVTNAAGAGIAGVRVIAYADFDNFNFTSSATTDATGGYTIRGLPQGGYKLQFAAELVTTASYRSQWWIDQPTMESSSLISLLPGENASGFNVALTKSAQISGTVTNSAKKGVAGVSVYLIGPKGEWDFITSVETGPTGAYTLRGVAAGTYKLRFEASYAATGSYVSTWSGSKSTYAAATGVTVSATQVKSGVNATLTTAAQISGTVTTGAGVGVPGVMVSLVDPVSGEATNMTTATDSAGKYTLRGVAAGSYKVSFNAEWVTVGSFLSNWNSGAPTLADAPTISVAKGASKTGVNSVLSGAGYISSVVISGDAPVAGAVFEAYLASGDGSTPVARATTDSNGRLTIRGLKDNLTYKLHMDTSGVTEGSVASGWMWGTTFADAGTVSVPRPEETFVAMTPETAGNMYGQITFDGQGIRGVRVEAYLPSDTNTPVASGLTDSSGNYLVRGIPQGTFKVRLSTEQVANGNYMSQWYGNTVGNLIGGDAASAVEMGMPHAVSINFNQTLTAAAALSGYLTTVTGDVLAGVQVTLIDAADESMEVATTQTNVAGGYNFRGVAQGAYKLRFDPSNYVGANLRVTWLNEKSSFSAAETINVTWGQSFAFGTSEVLAGAQALGKVTAKTGGKGIAGVTVVLCPIAISSTCYQSTTDAAGNYAISGIAAGSYRVNFDSATAAASYLPNFWTNGTTWDDATFVYFASRQVRTMNAQLVAAATVSGRVTNGAGEGIQDVQVMTYSTATERWLGAYAFTDAQGYYTLKGVQAGGVKLKFAADQARGAYVSEWSNDKATYSLAETITLAAGKTRSSVNAVLAPDVWTSIAGSVASGGAGAVIKVFDEGAVEVASVTADQAGSFAFNNLPAGTYRLLATPAGNSYCLVSNWYTGTSSLASNFGQAADVVVYRHQVTTLNSMTLPLLMNDSCI